MIDSLIAAVANHTNTSHDDSQPDRISVKRALG
jgi:hypothetical protein